MTDDITPEWLQEIGFERNKSERIPKLYLWVNDHLMAHAAFMSERFIRWQVNGNDFPEFAHPKTRDEVLRLCAAMGHNVQAQSWARSCSDGGGERSCQPGHQVKGGGE